MSIAKGLVGAALLLLTACGTPTSTPVAALKDTAPPAAMNTLSGAEKAAGWKLLFDGSDLKGWRGYKMAEPPVQWKVEDGAITVAGGPGTDLMTDDEFGEFELQADWKISPKGNSGIIYLVKEAPQAPATYSTGPEMQVIDNDGHPDGKFPTHRAGALYDFNTPPEGVVKPVGEWNRTRVVFQKGRIQHWLNGVKVAESSYGDDAWRRAVAASKFKDMPLFGKATSGHIALQNHEGDRVWFRNIKLRLL